MGYSKSEVEQYLAEVEDGRRFPDPDIEDFLAKRDIEAGMTGKAIDRKEPRGPVGKAWDPEAEAAAEAAKMRKIGAEAEPDRLRLEFMSGAVFAAGDWTVPDLIPNVLTQGEPCVMAGPMKSCKTTTSIDLAASLDMPSPFLGKWPVPERRGVGVVSCESGRATIHEIARRVYEQKGGDFASNGIHWAFDIPTLDDPGAPDMLADAITENALDCLILDPLYLLLSTGGDESSVFSMGKMLRPIGEVCQRTGATIILCHHAKKNRPNHFAPLELHEIAYSGTAEFARQWLLLARRSEFDPVNGKHELWLSYGGSAGNSGLWGLDITEGHRGDPGGRVYVPEVLKATEAREEANESRTAEKREKRKAEKEATIKGRMRDIERYLADHPDGDTERRILSGCGMSPAAGRPAIQAMKDAELIRPVPVFRGNRKAPYEGWQLCPEPGELDL
ncbi:AAA family ATPase [Saccharicrinis sp. FJH54]|uniref:AAA family ATPase n=1 Tax=Saccharicrinis sp. FJH54 TaxID=3344665 RepID=UPI0035D3DD36